MNDKHNESSSDNDTPEPLENPKEPLVIQFQIARVPIARFGAWLNHAFILIRAQPLPLILASSWILFIQLFLSFLFQGIGLLVFCLMLPLLTFGVADLCQKIRLQQPAVPMSMFEPFGHPIRARLFQVGIVFAIVLFGLFLIQKQLLNLPAFDGLLTQIQALTEIREPAAMQEGVRGFLANVAQNKRPILALFTLNLLEVVAQVVLMYAPLFAVWQNIPAGLSLQLSVRTVLKNSIPVVLAMGAVVLVAAVLMMVASIVGLLLGPLWMFTAMGAWIMIQTLINALIYTSYFDIIRHSLDKSVHDSIGDFIHKSVS